MKNIINKAKQGFTIVELVIVIAVIGILAGVLIPTFSNVISSANEAADLNEVQNSLKAYSGYISSQGKELSDGAIFNVRDTYYVFFEGSLHKFKVNKIDKDEEDSNYEKKNPNHFTVLDKGPKLGIDKAEYACNAKFQLIGEDGKPVKVANEEVWFYYYDGKEVTFEDGSKKVKIYAGQMISQSYIAQTKMYMNVLVKFADGVTEENVSYIQAQIYNPISSDTTGGSVLRLPIRFHKLVLGENIILVEDWEDILSSTRENNISFSILYGNDSNSKNCQLDVGDLDNMADNRTLIFKIE